MDSAIRSLEARDVLLRPPDLDAILTERTLPRDLEARELPPWHDHLADRADFRGARMVRFRHLTSAPSARTIVTTASRSLEQTIRAAAAFAPPALMEARYDWSDAALRAQRDAAFSRM